MEKKKNGFVMILMILLLALVGSALLVLSASTRTMRTNWHYSQINADCENITVSVKEWAKLNTDKLTSLEEDKSIAINLEGLITTRSTCQLSIVQRTDTEMTLNIAIDYSRGHLNGQKNTEFTLASPGTEVLYQPE